MRKLLDMLTYYTIKASHRYSVQERPEAAHKTLLGINNATMLTIAS